MAASSHRRPYLRARTAQPRCGSALINLLHACRVQIRDSEIFDDAFDDGLPSVDEATPVSKAPAKALKVRSDAPWCWSCVGSGVVEACADEVVWFVVVLGVCASVF